jgi:hypothetical protein
VVRTFNTSILVASAGTRRRARLGRHGISAAGHLLQDGQRARLDAVRVAAERGPAGGPRVRREARVDGETVGAAAGLGGVTGAGHAAAGGTGLHGESWTAVLYTLSVSRGTVG